MFPVPEIVSGWMLSPAESLTETVAVVEAAAAGVKAMVTVQFPFAAIVEVQVVDCKVMSEVVAENTRPLRFTASALGFTSVAGVSVVEVPIC